MNSCSVSCPTFRLRFLFFLHLSPLRPGICARSTNSFLPVISEISPNDSIRGYSPPIYDQTVFFHLNFWHFHYDALICHLLFLPLVLMWHLAGTHSTEIHEVCCIGWIMVHEYYSYSILRTIVLVLTPHIQNYLHLNRDLWDLLYGELWCMTIIPTVSYIQLYWYSLHTYRTTYISTEIHEVWWHTFS